MNIHSGNTARPSIGSRKKLLRPIQLLIIPGIPLLLLWSSCKDTVTQPGPSSVVFPDSGISYSQHVETLFQESCVAGGCHSSNSRAAGLSLERPSYRDLIDHQPQLVVAGVGKSSLLIQRIDGRVAPLMPFPQQPLTQNQINGIKKWIDEGALNN